MNHRFTQEEAEEAALSFLSAFEKLRDARAALRELASIDSREEPEDRCEDCAAKDRIAREALARIEGATTGDETGRKESEG